MWESLWGYLDAIKDEDVHASEIACACPGKSLIGEYLYRIRVSRRSQEGL